MKTQNNKNLLNQVAKLTSIFMLAMLIALACRLRRWRIRPHRRRPNSNPRRRSKLGPGPLWRRACRQRDRF